MKSNLFDIADVLYHQTERGSGANLMQLVWDEAESFKSFRPKAALDDDCSERLLCRLADITQTFATRFCDSQAFDFTYPEEPLQEGQIYILTL